MADSTVTERSDLCSRLEARASSGSGFEPWLFFPRGWDWPWLSYEESFRCVCAWAAELASLLPGGVLSRAPLRAPETLLLELACVEAGWLFRPFEGEGSRELTLSYRESPIRPELVIGPLFYRALDPAVPLTEEVDCEALELTLDGGASRGSKTGRDIVLCTGRPGSRLLGALLRDGAALILEPEARYLASGLALRPTVLVLGPDDLEPLGRSIDEADTRRSKRHLRRSLERLRLVLWSGDGAALMDLERGMERLEDLLSQSSNPIRPRLVVVSS